MGLSRRTLETLIDLVEIKLSCLEVIDREDAREYANLERCLDDLRKTMSSVVVDFPQPAGKGSRATV